MFGDSGGKPGGGVGNGRLTGPHRVVRLGGAGELAGLHVFKRQQRRTQTQKAHAEAADTAATMIQSSWRGFRERERVIRSVLREVVFTADPVQEERQMTARKFSLFCLLGHLPLCHAYRRNHTEAHSVVADGATMVRDHSASAIASLVDRWTIDKPSVQDALQALLMTGGRNTGGQHLPRPGASSRPVPALQSQLMARWRGAVAQVTNSAKGREHVDLLPPCWACLVLDVLASGLIEDFLTSEVAKNAVPMRADSETSRISSAVSAARFLMLAGDSIAVWMALNEDEEHKAVGPTSGTAASFCAKVSKERLQQGLDSVVYWLADAEILRKGIPVSPIMAGLCSRPVATWPAPGLRKRTVDLSQGFASSTQVSSAMALPSNGVEWFLLGMASSWMQTWRTVRFVDTPKFCHLLWRLLATAAALDLQSVGRSLLLNPEVFVKAAIERSEWRPLPADCEKLALLALHVTQVLFRSKRSLMAVAAGNSGDSRGTEAVETACLSLLNATLAQIDLGGEVVSLGISPFPQGSEISLRTQLLAALRDEATLQSLFLGGMQETLSVAEIAGRLRVLFPLRNVMSYFPRVATGRISNIDVERVVVQSLLSHEEPMEDDDEDEGNDQNEIKSKTLSGCRRTGQQLVSPERSTDESSALGFSEPIEVQAFDKLVMNTDLMDWVFQLVAEQFFDDCLGQMDRFVDSLGNAPGYSTDTGLLVKTFVAMLLRRCLVIDDSQLVLPAEMDLAGATQERGSNSNRSPALPRSTQTSQSLPSPADASQTGFPEVPAAAKAVWQSRHVLPFSLPQLNLFCYFLNQLSFYLTLHISIWCASQNRGIAGGGESPSFSAPSPSAPSVPRLPAAGSASAAASHSRAIGSHLLFDVCRLARLLHRRCRRLGVPTDPWVIPQASFLLRTGRLIPSTSGGNQPAPQWIRILSKNAVVTAQLGLLSEVPHCIAFKDRVEILRQVLRLDQQAHGRAPDDRFTPHQTKLLHIRRSHIIEDAVVSLMQGSDASRRGPSLDLKEPLRVRFLDDEGIAEMGIDGGGIFREFLIVLANELFKPERGLWRATANGLVPASNLWELPQQDDFDVSTLFELAGIVVGRALYDGILLGSAELSPVFLNRVLGELNVFDDLKMIDQEVYNNIQFVKHYKGHVEDLGLTFSFIPSDSITGREVPLLPGGGSVAVNHDNRYQYVILLSHMLTNSWIDRAVKPFSRGLFSLVDIQWLRLFDAHAVQQLISGGRKIGFTAEELRPHTVLGGGYTEESQTIQDFWDVVEESSDEFRAKLLFFVTSIDKAPLLGFQSLNPKFGIVRNPVLTDLPSASTCTNLLKLPDYRDRDLLKKQLTTAVYGTAGFHLA